MSMNKSLMTLNHLLVPYIDPQKKLGFICYLVHKRLNNLPGRPAISKTWKACLNAAPIICFIAKTLFHIARHYNLTACVKKMIFL